MYTIQKIELLTSDANERAVLVSLHQDGFPVAPVIRIRDAQGDYCFDAMMQYGLNPKPLTVAGMNGNPAMMLPLRAVGEMYRYWLAGNEDPMLLMLRKDTPVLHELYESAQDEVQSEAYVVLVPTEADAYAFAAELYAEHQGRPNKELLSDVDAEALYSMTERARNTKIDRDGELLLMNDERTVSYQVGKSRSFYWLTRAPR